MVVSAAASPTLRPRLACWLAAGLAGVAVLLVLSLATAQFQSSLDSDYLLAHIFAHSLGDAAHPISGWNYSSATFWFPDYVLYLPLAWLCGNSGLSYPLYAVANILLMGFTMAWSLAAAGVSREKAAVAAFFGLDLVLLSQSLSNHALWLWKLGLPAYHGGNVVNGFALMALGLGAARAGRWARIPSVAVVVLMFLALASNGLFLVHWLAPLLLALAAAAWSAKELRPVAWGLAWRAALAGILVLALRLALAKAEVFSFFSLVQVTPTPALIGSCLTRFVRQLWSAGMLADYWLFWLLGATGLAAAVCGLCSKGESDAVKRVALLAGSLSLLFAVVAPIVMNYWIDPSCTRYLVNWLLVPMWLLTLRVCSGPAPSRWLPHLAVATGLAGALYAAPQIDADQLKFPHPAEAQPLNDFCRRHDFKEGLCGYWLGHRLTIEWGFAGPQLGEIGDQAFPYLWCNNTYDYFPASPNDRGLARPAPQFIILNDLDPNRVMGFLNTKALRVAHVGAYAVAVLTPEQSQQAGELITHQALAALAGRRATWLQSQLPPVTK